MPTGTRPRADKDRLYRHVEFLTELRPFRNYQNLESLERVCDYLKQEFTSYGLQRTEQPFRVNGNEYKNIIATYNSEQQRRLIVGAHYDVCGDQPGADDNGSAVAGLLESARLVANAQPAIDYRIDFVAFTLEEPPFYGTDDMGSYVHARSVSELNDDVIGLINYEMIGYYHDGPQDYPHPAMAAVYPATADFVVVVGKRKYTDFNQKVFRLMKSDARIDVQLIDDPAGEQLASMSDQRSYWRFDIPALMINDTAFIRNPNYHAMSDDIDTLSFDHLTEVVSAAYQAVVGM